MSDLEILVLEHHPSEDYGTFGSLDRDGQQIALTCEPIQSVLVTGNTYLCIPHNGPEFQNVWEITGVEGHTAILIHNGNTIQDTRGCVLVGDDFGIVDGQHAVLNSVNTLNRLRVTLPSSFYLNITQMDD